MKSAPKHSHIPQKIILAVFLALFANLFVLDYFLVQQARTANVLGDTTTAAAACPKSCLTAINNISVGGAAAVKEFYIPLGGGTNATDDWTDVGPQVYIDSTLYKRIKKVTFDATIANPNGNQIVYARLYNANDGHPIWYSDVSMDDIGPTLRTSSPITLVTGNKLYKVQMKTQLKYPATLVQARVHITTY